MDENNTSRYLVPSLGYNEGSITHLGLFLSYITTHDLPVEMLRDAFQSKVTIVEVIFEALKVESGFICLLVLFFIISLIPLGTVIAWGCTKSVLYINDDDEILSIMPSTIMSSRTGIPSISGQTHHHHHHHNDTPPGESELALTETIDKTMHCRKRILSFLLQLVIAVLITTIVFMLVTNEQISSAVYDTPSLVKASVKDTKTFIKDAEEKIIDTLNRGTNEATENFKADLEGIGYLLGEPIQNELSTSTGLEIDFDIISNICSMNLELVHRIQLLRDTLRRAIEMSQDATLRIEELQLQLSVLQRQCSVRDKPLCDTLRIKNFDEMGTTDALQRIFTDPMLARMLHLGDIELDRSWKNLSTELIIAKYLFREYSLQIQNKSTDARNEIVRQIIIMNDTIQTSSRILTTLSRYLLDRVDNAWGLVAPLLDNLIEMGYFIGIMSLTASLSTLMVSMILVGALCFGCSQKDINASVTLIAGATTISLGSLALCVFAMSIMLLGGHGEVFLCRPLYESPDYTILTKLLDKPGLFYSKEPINGIIHELLNYPGLQRKSDFNISLASVLSNCEADKSTYTTFNLDDIANISEAMDYRNYAQLESAIELLGASETPFISLTQSIQAILETMLTESAINLTWYRMDLSQTAPEKYIATFTDQMQRVSLQIQDVGTSSKMTTLGGRVKRLQSAVLQPLEQLRGDILYHLTALELQMSPWTKSVNQSLIHLKTVQLYLDNEAGIKCKNKSLLYRKRLKDHLLWNMNKTLDLLKDKVALCRPLFDIFNANRILLCHYAMGALNRLWFSTFVCLILWTIATPISLSLASTFKKISRENRIQQTSSHQTPSDALMISEQSNWSRSHVDHPEIDRTNWC